MFRKRTLQEGSVLKFTYFGAPVYRNLHIATRLRCAGSVRVCQESECDDSLSSLSSASSEPGRPNGGEAGHYRLGGGNPRGSHTSEREKAIQDVLPYVRAQYRRFLAMHRQACLLLEGETARERERERRNVRKVSSRSLGNELFIAGRAGNADVCIAVSLLFAGFIVASL